MKSFKFICFVTILLLTFTDYSLSQDIFATVDGNNVTLWETGAQRNCGALYEMTVNLNDHYMKWVQLDTGLTAYCLCVYDLSVTYGPLEPGDYTVDVYFTSPVEPGEFYEGSTAFTIGGNRDVADGGIISQYQSECYDYFGINEKSVLQQDFNLYPIPVRDGKLLHLEAFTSGGKAFLEIFTLTGKLVYSKQYNENQLIQDRFIKDDLFPVSGLYLVRLRTDDQVYIRKITVL